MFNSNSGLVKIWFKAVTDHDSQYEYKDVPKLSNLREEVYKKIDTAYEFDKETE